MYRRITCMVATLAVLSFAAACGSGDDGAGDEATPEATAAAAPTKASGTLILATTTSTQDSGLLDELIPLFEEETGYDVKTIAVGSGQAIEQASNGDADVVLAHSPAAEQAMVDRGDGIERAAVMHNDFVIVGPRTDPSSLSAATTTNAAMTAIAAGAANFISRGDDSGTHALEKKLWTAAAIDPAGEDWYEETGQGMGATLQIANQKAAYTLSDRGTFLAQRDNLDLDILFEGAVELANPYHVIVVNPDKHPDVNVEAARAFAAFIVRADIQELIGQFGVEEFGEPLFIPDAGKAEAAGDGSHGLLVGRAA